MHQLSEFRQEQEEIKSRYQLKKRTNPNLVEPYSCLVVYYHSPIFWNPAFFCKVGDIASAFRHILRCFSRHLAIGFQTAVEVVQV